MLCYLATQKADTLGLVNANEFSNVIGNVTVEPVSTISDHKIVSSDVKYGRNSKMIKKIELRKLDDLRNGTTQTYALQRNFYRGLKILRKQNKSCHRFGIAQVLKCGVKVKWLEIPL